MLIQVGKAYIDRKGNIWDCVAASIADKSAWCTNRNDGLDRLFTINGKYLFENIDHDFDLITELEQTKYVFNEDDTIIAQSTSSHVLVVRHGDGKYSIIENGLCPHPPMESVEYVMRALVFLI